MYYVVMLHIEMFAKLPGELFLGLMAVLFVRGRGLRSLHAQARLRHGTKEHASSIWNARLLLYQWS